MRAHLHVITLDHLHNGYEQFVCECGEAAIGRPALVRGMIFAHRMMAFPIVRARVQNA